MRGASSAGKSYSREKRVHGLKPRPISASSAPVRYLIMLVLPLWVLPKSQKTGTAVLPRSSLRRSCSSSSRGAEENQRLIVLNMHCHCRRLFIDAQEGNVRAVCRGEM